MSLSGRIREHRPTPARPEVGLASRELDRRALSKRLRAYQEELGAPEPAIRAAASLAEPGSSVVVTGQQPGLLGGPLLTLSKALSAIAWSRIVREKAPGPVVPIFWAATEDHDLDEVNQLVLLDREDRVHRLRLDLQPDGSMLSGVSPGPGASELLDQVEELLPPTEFRPELLELLRRTRSDSLGLWFSRLISAWLGPLGLVVVEPRLLRQEAAGVLELERSRPGAILDACGGGPVEPHQPPFFQVREGRRIRPVSSADLPVDPMGISWDALTRVLAQNLALPVIGHVVGPNEALYCQQVAPAHRLLGLPAPPLIPRAGLTLVEGKVARALDRFSRSPEQVETDGSEALRTELREPPELGRALDGIGSDLDGRFQELHRSLKSGDETLRRKAEGAEKEIRRALDRLRAHGRKSVEREAGADQERARKVLAHLLPGGRLQERALSPLTFLNRHGPDLPARLLAVIEQDPAAPWVIRLAPGGS